MSNQVRYYIAAISATIIDEAGFTDQLTPLGFWHLNLEDAQKLAYNYSLRRWPVDQGFINHMAICAPTVFTGDGYPTTLGQLLDTIPVNNDGQVLDFQFTLNLNS